MELRNEFYWLLFADNHDPAHPYVLSEFDHIFATMRIMDSEGV